MLDGLDEFLARAIVGRSVEAAAGRARQGAALHPQWAEAGAEAVAASTSVRGFNATMAIRAAAAKLFADLDYVISPVSPVVNFAAEFAVADQRSRTNRSSTSPTPCRGTWRKIRPPRSMAASTRQGFPIGVQIVGRRFDDLGVLGMAKAFEGLRGPQKPWPSAAEEVTRARHSGASRSDEPGISTDRSGSTAKPTRASRNDD